MDPLRVAAYGAHFLAVVSLFAAGQRVPSLRRAAWATLAWLLLSPLRGFDRDDGRALYHVAQAAEWADHALLVWVAGAPLWLAAILFAAMLGAGLAWWPAPATTLYALAQLATVLLAAGALSLESRRWRVPLPGHGAALVLAGSELACLVAPYLLATVLEEPVAALFDAARVVRVATWAALAVVGWASWRSSGSWSVSSWRASSRRSGEDGTRAPHREQPASYWPRDGQRGSDGSAGGIDARG